jgi:hypothetical protein
VLPREEGGTPSGEECELGTYPRIRAIAVSRSVENNSVIPRNGSSREGFGKRDKQPPV